jgi:hypothetical protein
MQDQVFLNGCMIEHGLLTPLGRLARTQARQLAVSTPFFLDFNYDFS